MVKKYIEKEPTPIEAIQWTGNNLGEVEDFIGTYGKASADCSVILLFDKDKTQKVQEGDWIVKDPETGDFYEMADVYFSMYYKEVPPAWNSGVLRDFSDHVLYNKMLGNEI